MFPKRLIKKIAIKLGVLIHNVNADIARVTLPKFGNLPKNIKIDLPRRIAHPEHIFLGDNIRLGPGSLLNAITRYPPTSWMHSEGNQDTRITGRPDTRSSSKPRQTPVSAKQTKATSPLLHLFESA